MRGKRTHKGKTRHFTPREEIDRQLGRVAQEGSSDGESSGNDANSDSDGPAVPKPSTSSTNQGANGADENEAARYKGMSHLIGVRNPNAGVTTTNAGVSRREAEAAARAAMDPIKLKSEVELASDLARLALVRKERERAETELAEEKKAHEARKQAAAASAQLRLQAIRQKSGKPGSSSKNKRQVATGDKPSRKDVSSLTTANPIAVNKS